MSKNTKIIGASFIGVGSILAFVGQWIVTGAAPPTEFWITAITLIAGSVGWFVKIRDEGK